MKEPGESRWEDAANAEVNRRWTAEGRVQALSDMTRARVLERHAMRNYCLGMMGGWLILQTGQEGVAAGVCSLLGPGDHTITGARGMGVALMRGVSMERCLAELMGKVTGASKGKAGMFSFYDPAGNHWGAHGVAAAQTPLAAGLAFALKQRDEAGAVVCFLGDGAVNQGVYHETLNLAGLFGLPVVFLIENNGYAMGTSVRRSSVFQECLAKRAEMYGIEWDRCEGHDVPEVRACMEPALRRAREEGRPTVVEVETYRYHGLTIGDANHHRYRKKEEIEWRKANRDPVKRWGERLMEEGILAEGEVEAIREAAIEEAVAAVTRSREARPPGVEEICGEVYWETDHRTAASRIGRHFFNDEG